MNPSTTFANAVATVQQRLEAAELSFGHGTDNAFDEAVWLICSAANLEPDGIDEATWGTILDHTQLANIESICSERVGARRPLAYINRRMWFAGHEFYVDERVLIPRSHLGEWIDDRFEPWINAGDVRRILDLCTGSGCIGVALAYAFPDAQIVASDVSRRALQVAQTNVKRHRLEQRIELIHSDLFDQFEGRQFDLIVSNPPYVGQSAMQELPAEYRHEPDIALNGGTNGLALIDQILLDARRFLADTGVLVLEAASAAPALKTEYPDVPFNWLASGGGDEVLLIISAAELKRLVGSKRS
ncbi:MAG: 50S ribosomal protein L3 N(5)-glutamine methyltransferase [Gammaproteobacteria bacterium]|nr:50S ribosomal protein L3 N(5)-glutamine methyltransferase [Gammaproteobacteria bacterium]MDH3465731.1 50S ribosomal protein L3 N(5)-glutamine methyltransferase [Gammaproteobacteria bacterium]